MAIGHAAGGEQNHPEHVLKEAIVVTGLPASGKTSLGKALATELGFKFFDKDDYLECLFEQRGVGDEIWRNALSRESDGMFQHAATQCQKAVLVSHWRGPNSQNESGTPTNWLCSAYDKLVQIHCDCPAVVAAQRFERRVRHIGHGDDRRSFREILIWLERMESQNFCSVGPTIHVDATGPIDVLSLVKQIKKYVF